MNIKTLGVVGAGQMGSGIAQVAITSGFEVVLHDVKSEFVEKGRSAIEGRLASLVKKEKMTEGQKKDALGRLRTSTHYSDFRQAQLIVEAATENESVKAEIFRKVGEVAGSESILASNTSSISITRLANYSGRPEKFIGIHFMNPVPIMKLVEIIRGLQTSDATYQTSLDFVRKLNKDTITVSDAPGFLINRILCPMINEAIFALESGISTPEDIDKGMKLGTNQPMGPLELADFVGLDTVLYIMEVLHRGLGEDKFRPAPLLRKYVDAGYLGRKTGRGFFTYKA